MVCLSNFVAGSDSVLPLYVEQSRNNSGIVEKFLFACCLQKDTSFDEKTASGLCFIPCIKDTCGLPCYYQRSVVTCCAVNATIYCGSCCIPCFALYNKLKQS